MDSYPRFYILGARPVKLILNDQGELGSLSFNWETGEFELDWDVYLQIYKPESEAERISEQEFEKYVKELCAKLRRKKENQ